MEYKAQGQPAIKPRLIIHGGAGNIQPDKFTPEKYAQYREALLTIVSDTERYMTTPRRAKDDASAPSRYPSALEIATYAVTRLEDNALFNSGHGAVFTRDGVNELEASVMVSRGRAKRGVGVTGLRRVRNPILLARAMLERGADDLTGKTDLGWAGQPEDDNDGGPGLDVPSAQGHTLLHGRTAEILAERYGLALVGPAYFFTQNRWDEHVRALEREKARARPFADDGRETATATWSPDEYLPQGTCGAVALDSEGVVCVATSTGGMTNKLTGRIGDTPSMGAGFWAEEWDEQGAAAAAGVHTRQPPDWRSYLGLPGRAMELGARLRGLVSDCLPSPFLYTPLHLHPHPARDTGRQLTTTRSAALSGTGNGDSFLRVAAVHTVVTMARWASLPTAEALHRVAGPGGVLQRSAGDRWGKTGEGEGGMIGIESVVARNPATGAIVEARSEVVQDFNCGGMFRAWIDDDGVPVMRIWDGVKDGELKGPK